MSTIRAFTRQRRARIESLKRSATINELRERLSIERQVAQAMCRGVYGADGCACESTPHKPACERMEGIGRHIVDIVRRHDRKDKE